MSRKMVGIQEAANFLGVCPQTLRRWEREGLALNAAKNLLAYGLAILNGPTVSSTGRQACGEEGAGFVRKSEVKPASVKQEVSFVPV